MTSYPKVSFSTMSFSRMNLSSLPTTLLLGTLLLGTTMAAACGGSGDAPDEMPPMEEPAAGAGAAEAQGPGQGATDSGDSERLTGQVLITGTAQMDFVTLQIDGGGAVNLSGALLPELRRLAGAMVSVQGSRTAATPLEGFEATAYEVTSIDGQRPSVGILEERDGGFTIVGAETVRLNAIPDALRSQVGAKVWVVGRETDSGLQVQSYGVIREP